MESGPWDVEKAGVDRGLDLREEAWVPCGHVSLPATLTVPSEARGMVVFAHGSGSGRGSPRNRFVAEALHAAGLGTLLVDLVLPGDGVEEDPSSQRSLDVAFLARRLLRALEWMGAHDHGKGLPAGLFGSSTGAAAALLAAAQPSAGVRAIVCRGGRTDLATHALPGVTAPTLLVVGGNDPWIRRVNEASLPRLRGESELVVVPGAGHLFEEPGALARVAALSASWFQRHLVFAAKAAGEA